jgi:hypothetical protein
MTADAITNEAQTYDVTLQWNDSDFNEFSARVLRGAAINSADEPEQAKAEEPEQQPSGEGDSSEDNCGDGDNDNN